jgi:hypothetical protein
MACRYLNSWVLERVCRELMEKYNHVSLHVIRKEYNSRCPPGYMVRTIFARDLKKALVGVPAGLCYSPNGSLAGIIRNSPVPGTESPGVGEVRLTQYF